ncbi:hypothetical protein KO516_21015 [Citreicella sp. C3M06]|uniref:hypothetical protein n=1 Tax=Citreicella sp. C3M06 TaxID=2841564 RepID=UPI001C0A270A|nr:hypothetical protein [Citreicella sp. C3M06]MBU2963260.1 hypothetical protein [Citreicella sp. C3M06]
MIRPEARAAFARWSEALWGCGVLALGLYWAFFTGGGLLHWLGYAVALAGGLLLLAGIQRGRFRTGSGGPGIVRVIEGRITYMGPLTGGVADLDALTRLELDPSGKPAHWMLHQAGQPTLAIPVNATGGEVLFDAFSALPGLQTERMLSVLNGTSREVVTLWQEPTSRIAHLRLH